jgi:BASS family bile acid:Na+ symporter
MIDLLAHAFKPVVLIFVVSTMLASGLGLTVRQIFGPFHNFRVTASFVVGSYIIIPLLAIVLARLFGLEDGLRYGLVILAMSAGAEAGPKATAISNGNVGLSVGLLIASIGISIFYVPLMLGLLLPDVHIATGHLLMKLLITVALPIIVGLFIKARFEKFADHVVPYLHKISTLFMLITAALLIILNFSQIIALFGTFAILATFLLIAVGFGIGYLLGWPDQGSRLAMGFMHGGRNSSIGLVVASQAFSDNPQVLLMITIGVTMMVLVLIPLAVILKIKPGSTADIKTAH